MITQRSKSTAKCRAKTLGTTSTGARTPKRKVVVRKRTDGTKVESGKIAGGSGANLLSTAVKATAISTAAALAVIYHASVLNLATSLPFLIFYVIGGLGSVAILYTVYAYKKSLDKLVSQLPRSKLSSRVAEEDLFSKRGVACFSAVPRTPPVPEETPPMPGTPPAGVSPADSKVTFSASDVAQLGSASVKLRERSAARNAGGFGRGSRKQLTTAFQIFCVLVIAFSTVKIKRTISEAAFTFIPSASRYFALVAGITWFGLSLVFYLISRAKKLMDGCSEDEDDIPLSADVLYREEAKAESREVSQKSAGSSGRKLAKGSEKSAQGSGSKGSKPRSVTPGNASREDGGDGADDEPDDEPDDAPNDEPDDAADDAPDDEQNDEPDDEPDDGRDEKEEEIREEEEEGGAGSQSRLSISEVVSGSTRSNSVLDISNLMVENDEGENIMKKSEIVTTVEPGKWVKENDRDWKVVERKKKSLDFSMTFATVPQPELEEKLSSSASSDVLPSPPPSEHEPESKAKSSSKSEPESEPKSEPKPPESEKPESEKPESEKPESEPPEPDEAVEEDEVMIDPSKIRGSPEIPCNEGMDMEFDEDGSLKRNTEHLKLRREKWVETYKARSRLLQDGMECPSNRSECRGQSLIGKLECWAINHPRTPDLHCLSVAADRRHLLPLLRRSRFQRLHSLQILCRLLPLRPGQT